MYECAGCGFVALDPLPNTATRADLYDDAYGGASTGYFAKTGKKMARARRRAAAIARKVKPQPGEAPRFLDVGSSAGFMVEAAREKGFDGVGVELDGASVSYACEHYPNNTFFHGTVEDYVNEYPVPFDSVYTSEVIEHTADANTFLAAISALTRPGGLLYLTTPDIGHRRRPKDLTAWDGFCPPSHCLYFTEGSLRLLLEKHGYRDIRRRFAWKPGLKVLARKI